MTQLQFQTRFSFRSDDHSRAGVIALVSNASFWRKRDALAKPSLGSFQITNKTSHPQGMFTWTIMRSLCPTYIYRYAKRVVPYYSNGCCSLGKERFRMVRLGGLALPPTLQTSSDATTLGAPIDLVALQLQERSRALAANTSCPQ